MTWTLLLLACGEPPAPPAPIPVEVPAAPPPTAPPADWSDTLVLASVVSNDFVQRTMKAKPPVARLQIDDSGQARSLVIHRQRELVMPVDADTIHWLVDAMDKGTNEVVTLDYAILWTPSTTRTANPSEPPTRLDYAVHALSIQAVDGRDRYRWVHEGDVWVKHDEPVVPADWTQVGAIRAAVAAYFEAQKGGLGAGHLMVPDRYGPMVYAVVHDGDHGSAAVIDGDSARWLVDAHGPVSGEKVVLDYPIEWDGSAFQVREPEIQAVGGVAYYTWESVGDVVVRRNMKPMVP